MHTQTNIHNNSEPEIPEPAGNWEAGKDAIGLFVYLFVQLN